MFKKFFVNSNEQEKLILEFDRDLNPEVYNYLNALIKLDAEGKVIYYNQVFAKLFGFRAQDFNNNFFDIVLKDNSFELRALLENASIGKVQRINTIGFAKDGNSLNINVTVIPIENKARKEFYVIIKDNIDHQEINQFQRMQKGFDKIDNICSFYYDAINDYHYFSKQFTDMLKINPENRFTPSLKHLLRYVHPEDQELLKNSIKDAL